MVGFSHISQKRRGLAKGQRVEVNEFFYRVYPFSRARTGTVLRLSRGTQIIVQFDQLKAKMSLDERCVEIAMEIRECAEKLIGEFDAGAARSQQCAGA